MKDYTTCCYASLYHPPILPPNHQCGDLFQQPLAWIPQLEATQVVICQHLSLIRLNHR